MQVQDGESLLQQRRQLEGYAQIHGWDLDRMFEERFGVDRHRTHPSGRKELLSLRCFSPMTSSWPPS